MPWPGVWSNFIAKSGGNTYHGKIYADYQNKGIQASNIPDTLTCAVPRRPLRQPAAVATSTAWSSYHDVNGDIGGYLKKDKLWWYCSAARPEHQVAAAELPGEAVRDRASQPDRQGHLRADPEQQVHRLRAGRPEAAAQPPGHLP